jgi:glycosyltransferase involved in cell wall biosynthesis
VRPKVSIVTSSYNQAEYIGRTIESIRAQDYPEIEHIVVDGMSNDGTVDVLARYPHLKVIREPDRGQADAINKGFRAATGDIFGFVNSDDTLEPGAVTAVVQAIEPAAGRHIVMGRCRFIDEQDRFLGVEHPSAFESHRRVLEIWRGHCLPQPSTFWTREVWERSGPLNADEQLMLDYDLFCRFSRDYDFHVIDRVLANYRLHTQSKTNSVTDAERLTQAITVSRRYWGSPFGPQYWRIMADYLWFKLDRRGRAAGLMRTGRDQWRHGQRLRGGSRIVAGSFLAPDVASDVVIMPVLKPIVRSMIRRPLLPRRRAVSPQTQAYLSGTDLYGDNWAGPNVILTRELERGQTSLLLAAHPPPGELAKPLTIEAFVDGRSLGARPADAGGAFHMVWPVTNLQPRAYQVRLKANGFVVPHDFLGTHDYRPLSYHVVSLQFTNDPAHAR